MCAYEESCVHVRARAGGCRACASAMVSMFVCARVRARVSCMNVLHECIQQTPCAANSRQQQKRVHACTHENICAYVIFSVCVWRVLRACVCEGVVHARLRWLVCSYASACACESELHIYTQQTPCAANSRQQQKRVQR